MAKKQAVYTDWEVLVEDNGKIIVKQSGQVLPNAKEALRTISAAVGFTIEPKWNTQQAGSKLVDFLNSTPTATADTPAKPQPVETRKCAKSQAPTHQPETEACTTSKPVSPKNGETFNDEKLAPEDMKQLEEISKRLDTVEKRLASLEKGSSGGKDYSGQLYVTGTIGSSNSIRVYQRNPDGTLIIRDYYSPDNKDKRSEVYGEISMGNYSKYEYINLPRILQLSNGDFIYVPAGTCIGGTDASLRETKAFATQIGFDIPEKTTMAALAGEIMREKGRNGWCVGNGSLLNGSGYTYTYTVVDIESLLTDFAGQIGLLKQLPVPSLKGKSIDEKFEIVADYYSKLCSYPLPPKEQVTEDFKKACEEYDKLYK